MKSSSKADPQAKVFYQSVLMLLLDSKIPFMVGGAHALKTYTGIERDTKDFDVFLRGEQVTAALDLMRSAGFRTELTDSVWLGKAFEQDMFVDFIFGFGNGLAKVDDSWFAHAKTADIFGLSTLVIAAEDMIWSKAYIMERDRFDGADVLHLILRCSDRLDWERLLQRFGDHWRLLLIYLIYFRFIYPGKQNCVPEWLYAKLVAQLESDRRHISETERACLGELFSRTQYQVDMDSWGLVDARAPFHPAGSGGQAQAL